jgi:hypothetical protein
MSNLLDRLEFLNKNLFNLGLIIIQPILGNFILTYLEDKSEIIETSENNLDQIEKLLMDQDKKFGEFPFMRI